jgi:site-specific recombinase XerD
LFKHQPIEFAELCTTLRDAIGSDLPEVESYLMEVAAPPAAPFILYEDHSFPHLPNAFLRSRCSGNIFDTRVLSPSSLWDYARDLSSFLSLYSDPDDGDLTDTVFSHYLQYLSETLSDELSSSTIERREYVVRSFREFIAQSGGAMTLPATEQSGRVRTFINFANVRVATNKKLPSRGRRRAPGLLKILPPDELRRFIAAFECRTLRATAMTIYSTGGRRLDVCQLTAGTVVNLRPPYPGGTASITVRSKGGKLRQLEIETDLQKGLKSCRYTQVGSPLRGT